MQCVTYKCRPGKVGLAIYNYNEVGVCLISFKNKTNSEV